MKVRFLSADDGCKDEIKRMQWPDLDRVTPAYLPHTHRYPLHIQTALHIASQYAYTAQEPIGLTAPVARFQHACCTGDGPPACISVLLQFAFTLEHDIAVQRCISREYGQDVF